MSFTFSTKRILGLVILIICLMAGSTVFAQTGEQFSISESPLPPPTAPVNDYVGVFTEVEKRELNERLIEFNKTWGVEFAVAVVETTGNRDIFDYSLAVARGWGIGSTAQDNPGALLFVAVKDRKYFTQVSSDLEDELPDGIVGSLQRQFLVPQFRQGNYSKGISDTIDAYMRTFDARRSGGPLPPDIAAEPASDDAGDAVFQAFCCLAGIFILIMIIAASRGDDGKGGRGSGGGGSGLPWVLASILASSAGSGGSSGSSWGGGSSDWGGGGGWGGFGGGGDFGGGGAGGGW